MRPIGVICSIAVILMLAGCPGVPSLNLGSTPPPPAAPAKVALRDFTIPQQQAIAKACNSFPDNDIMQDVCADWERMRAALK